MLSKCWFLKTSNHFQQNVHLKVVIPRTVCRHKKMVFRPPEANNQFLIKPFEIGHPLGMLSKSSNACDYANSWKIVNFSKTCSKNAAFSYVLTSKYMQKQHFFNLFLKNSSNITNLQMKRWKHVSKRCQWQIKGFPSFILHINTKIWQKKETNSEILNFTHKLNYSVSKFAIELCGIRFARFDSRNLFKSTSK